MADIKIVNEWLSKADDDFNFAEANLKEKSEFYAQICFFFHQAAEKYLKAFIIAYNLEFEKIHNLIGLLRICAKKEPSLLSLFPQCDLLNAFYIETRYPVHWPTNYTREKALDAKEAVKEIAETIKGWLVMP
ncbi:MAG: HEPN domain-containing protein [bacterium]